MNEELSPRPPESRPQPKEMKHYLELLKDHGVDFEESDLEHLAPMDDYELTEYFLQALLEAGVEDPEGFMVEHALVEVFREHTQEELIARNSQKLKGEDHSVDQLDEEDLRLEGDV
jgi:hypothetical protein